MRVSLNAEWVWTGKTEVNSYADFFAEFSLAPGKTEGAKLFISADSNLRAHINGELAAFQQYSDYPDDKTFAVYDISAFVTEGRNTLAVTVYYIGKDCSVYKTGAAGLIYEIRQGGKTVCASGGGTLCRPSPYYQSGDGVEVFSPQLLYSFKFDCGLYDGFWEKGFRPGGDFKPAAPARGARLSERPVKLLELEPRTPCKIRAQGVFAERASYKTPAESIQRAYLSHIDSREIFGAGVLAPADVCALSGGLNVNVPGEERAGADGAYLVCDLGREEAGFLDLDITVPAACKAYIGFGEHLDDLRVRAHIGPRNFAVEAGLKKGRNRFTHYFKRLGARYLQLFVFAHEFVLSYAGLLPAVYPLVTADADIPDLLHRRIYEVSARTLRLCMHEHYEDCPWREQALYTMDSRNQMLCGYYLFNETQYPLASLRLLAKGLRKDGLLELCAPATVPITIPSFSLIFIRAAYEYLKFSGDKAGLDELMPAVNAILAAFKKKLENGLVSIFAEPEYWNFYEWEEGLDGSLNQRETAAPSMDAPLSAFYSIALTAMAGIAELMQNPAEAAFYKEAADEVNKRINAAFWQEDKGCYATFLKDGRLSGAHELTQSLLLYCGAATKKRGEKAAAALLSGKLVPVTLSYSIFKYEGLLMLSKKKYAPVVAADIAGIWGGMLYDGATSFYETVKAGWDFENAGSLCHGWSAVPAYIYKEWLWRG